MKKEVKVLDAKEPRWSNHEHTAIELLVMFSSFPDQYLPFNADPNDYMDYSKSLYSRAKAGEFGTIAECNLPTAEELEMLTFPQRQAAAMEKTESRISILSRAVKLGVATGAEKKELEDLERYSIVLMRATGPAVPVFEG